MFGTKKRTGKKVLKGNGVSLICDVDDYGNIIPETCEPLISEEQVEVESFKYPQLPLPDED